MWLLPYAIHCLIQVRQGLAEELKNADINDTQDAVLSYFIEKVHSNLRVVLCMSPVGYTFR